MRMCREGIKSKLHRLVKFTGYISTWITLIAIYVVLQPVIQGSFVIEYGVLFAVIYWSSYCFIKATNLFKEGDNNENERGKAETVSQS
jgi:hypothetical protein